MFGMLESSMVGERKKASVASAGAIGCAIVNTDALGRTCHSSVDLYMASCVGDMCTMRRTACLR